MPVEKKKKVKESKNKRKIRYAVVGVGYISQVAVLPGFKHASKNSDLVALVSGDPRKLKKLGKKYDVPHVYSYDQYDECLKSGEIDAVFIALPNSMHKDYTERAASAGIHILCEKPMAITEQDCVAMTRAADQNKVKLMIAYRLHFDEANLKAIEIINSGKIGEARIFNSVFCQQVRNEDNIRLKRDLGGGSVPDMGVYCINAARYLFQDEPIEITAFTANNGEPRFKETDEMTSAIMRFPGDRLATFTSSFGAADTGSYQVVGTKGNVVLEPGYEYAVPLKMKLTIDGKTREKTFKKRDHFAAEIAYFSDCIINNIEPEPSGEEGLADVRIIQAINKSAEKGKPVKLPEFKRNQRPSAKQEIHKPATRKPELVNADAPSDE